MSRLARAIVATSAMIMLAVIVGMIVWMVAEFSSYSAGKAVFAGSVLVVWGGASAWLGLRIANRLLKQNRDFMNSHRRKQD